MSWFWLFIGFSLLGELLENFSAILPLLFVGLIVFGVLNKANNNAYKRKKYKSQSSAKYNKTTTSNNSVSNGDLNKIDKKLTEYFSNNIILPLVEDISLTTRAGKYSTVDQLYISYKDEKVIKLADFGKQYPEIYKKIMDLLLIYAKKDISLKKNEPVRESKKKSEAESFIDKIDELNRAIPQEEITNGLYQTCDLLKQIDFLKETSNDATKIKKLYSYYLPILIDTLERYKKLQDAKYHGEEFKKCETQLIKTIVLINEALKTMCENMQEDDYMDMNANMSTLKSLLEKDGFGKNPFE